eukprot:1294326-Rhodomonas_salina.1
MVEDAMEVRQIKLKKTQSQYNLYQNCVLCCLIPPSTPRYQLRYEPTPLPSTEDAYGATSDARRLRRTDGAYSTASCAVRRTDGACGGKRTERKRKGLRWCAAPMRPWFKALATPRRGGAESSPIT